MGRKDKREERIKKNFENHVATIDQFSKFYPNDYDAPLDIQIETLTWKKSDSYNYYVKYIHMGNTLCVFGDLGEAIYRWSEPVTFEWLSNLDLSYFAGKCQASEVGRDFKEWDEHKALDAMKHFAKEKYFKWSKFKEEERPNSLYDEREWEEWLRANGNDILGDYYWEWAYGIGKTFNTRCVYHFVGLQMAMKQIRECGAIS